MTYKGGGVVSPHGISLIKNDFIVTANNTKPLIHVWPINSQEQVPGVRFVAPGKVLALTTSPDGNFLVAGVQEILHIWHISSGKMLNALSRHYQNITKIQFTDDGTHFISAGQDGNVLVWNLSMAVSHQQSDVQPLWSFNDHGLGVTDFHIGTGGIRAFLYTVSMDRTCRIYDLASGQMLLNIVFAEALQCIAVNKLETVMYIGPSEGAIYEFNIQSPPRMKEYHMTDENYTNRFTGHTGAVKCLALSHDGEMLMSGGADENIHLWHITSKQLLRTLPHKGYITNAIFSLATRNMFDQENRLNFIGSSLKRMMDAQNAEDDYAIEVMVTESTDFGVEKTQQASDIVIQSKTVSNCNGIEQLDDIEKLRREVASLRKANKELFEYSVKNILIKK